jgi:hypothetical protein
MDDMEVDRLSRSFQREAVFELQFWMQILGDHSRFIYNSLAPSETSYIQQASYFINRFDELLSAVREPLADRQLAAVIGEAGTVAQELRSLKLSLIKEHLVGNVRITLTPSFLNHMVNELDEALLVLSYLGKGELTPRFHPLHHDLLWLLDAAGHAAAINDSLNNAEKKLKRRAWKYTKYWEEFYLKATELAGFLRTKVAHFPALAKFHSDVELEMAIFTNFLNELEEMELNKEILGILTPLMADHMLREEWYYLIKLAQTTDVKMPPGDPIRPRVEE